MILPRYIKLGLTLVVSATAAFAILNTVCLVLGFGQPPLVILDSEIEYYLKPNMSYKRFGNSIYINRYGMRSRDFDKTTDVPFFAILGDSVVYGEHTLDQSQTLASQLNQRLGATYHDKSIIVGSIAASSWGPGNILTYMKKFGPFIGKTAFLVLSSHDRVDVPFMLSGRLPYRTEPATAPATDFAESSIGSILGRINPPETVIDYQDRLNLAHASLEELIRILTRDFEQVVLVFHATKTEALRGISDAEAYYSTISNVHNIKFFSTLKLYKELYDQGEKPHEDNIHLTASGNKKLSERMLTLFLLPN